MLRGILGRKVGMSQIFTENGVRIPVTVIDTGPVTVVQVRTEERDGYVAAQVGYEPITKQKHINKPTAGHFKKVQPTRVLREFPFDGEGEAPQPGDTFDLSLFSEGEKVNVSGVSKGKGFQGVIKRHGFSGGPDSHGSRFHRRPGSIGNRTFPGRVFPGKKMAGHMGNKRVTVRNLEIARIMPEQNILLVRGAVPGPNGGLLEIRKPKT